MLTLWQAGNVAHYDACPYSSRRRDLETSVGQISYATRRPVLVMGHSSTRVFLCDWWDRWFIVLMLQHA